MPDLQQVHLGGRYAGLLSFFSGYVFCVSPCCACARLRLSSPILGWGVGQVGAARAPPSELTQGFVSTIPLRPKPIRRTPLALVGCPWCAWGDHGAICVAWTVEFDAPTLRWRVHGALPGRWSLPWVGNPPTWLLYGKGDSRQQFNDSRRGVGAAVRQFLRRWCRWVGPTGTRGLRQIMSAPAGRVAGSPRPHGMMSS